LDAMTVMICWVATERARPASRSDSSASRRHSSDDCMFMRALYRKAAALPVTRSPDCHNPHLRCKLSSIQVPAAGTVQVGAGLSNIETKLGGHRMAQAIEDWFICDGRYRVHAIGPLGRRGGRIIEIEEVDTGERFHGSANRMEKLMQTLRRSTNDDHGLRYR
jgi:hypothetical protein